MSEGVRDVFDRFPDMDRAMSMDGAPLHGKLPPIGNAPGSGLGKDSHIALQSSGTLPMAYPACGFWQLLCLLFRECLPAFAHGTCQSAPLLEA
jgi:hypothetical protein